MSGDRSQSSGVSVIGGVDAGAVTQGGALNTVVEVSGTDVPINAPAGSWRSAKVIVVTPDLVVATAVNEAAALGTAGTPPAPVYGAGDIDIGPSTEWKPVSKADGSPFKGGTDQIHFIASGAGTVRLVWVK